VDDVAALCERLAVLLSSGLGPSSAWQYVSDGAGRRRSAVDDRITRVAAAVVDGEHVPDALLAESSRGTNDEAWRAVAAAWAVSARSGAPLAPALRSFSDALRSLAQSRREVDTALAGPLVTSRIVLALPLAAVALGSALGFDVIGVLFGSPVGFVCLGLGGALALCAVLWVSRLAAGARRGPMAPGLAAELVAIALGGGSSGEAAVELVTAAVERAGLDLSVSADVWHILDLSRRAGVPAGELLRSEAESSRRAARAEGAARAARLGSLLMIPLGVCVLPAFLVLGVVPMVLSLLSSTGLTL
jgi:tight adherence protein B